MTREVEVTIKPDGSSLAVCIYNSGMLEMGARVRRESDDVTEEILYQVATIHEDMVSQRDELGRELLQLKQERDQLKQINERWRYAYAKDMDRLQHGAGTSQELVTMLENFQRIYSDNAKETEC